MKQSRILFLLGLALLPLAALGTDQFYTNNSALTTPPQVDAINFINNGSFNLVTSAPYKTANTRNFTNNGTMTGFLGYQFDTWTPIGNTHKLADNFMNRLGGVVEAQDVVINSVIVGGPGGPFTTLLQGGSLLVSSTNIVSEGLLEVGAGGKMLLTGTNINLKRSGVAVNPIIGNGSFNDQNTGQFQPDIAVYDNYWGQANLTFDSRILSFIASPQYPVQPPNNGSDQIVLFDTIYGDFNVTDVGQVTLSVTNMDGSTEDVDVVTNTVREAIFVGVTDDNFEVSIGFSGSSIANNPYNTAAVLLSFGSTNIVTGLPETTDFYLADTLAAETPRGLLANITGSGTFRPANLVLSRLDFGVGGSGNASFEDFFFYDNVFTNFDVASEYSGYSASVDHVTSRPPPIPAGTITNVPGRVTVRSDGLDLTKTRVRGEGLLDIQAKHLVGSSNALVDGESLTFTLGSTNGNLLFQDLAKTNVTRLTGGIRCWSGVWQNFAQVITTNYSIGTNAALETTFPNPTPAGSDQFGFAVAGVGEDKVLIGSHQDNVGAGDAGVAHLFATNGTLLITFTNPTPAIGDKFGNAVAAVGTNMVLIGAFQDDTNATDAGAAYLFDATTGALLTTFTNPTPQVGDRFGFSVAAFDTNKVIIGAPQDNTGAAQAGAAYLFGTNGVLIKVFNNPAPAIGDRFGNAVAAVGVDQVLIGAFRDAASTGAAYLFNTNGTLVTTFTPPASATNSQFGISVAAIGTDQVLIGAVPDPTATNSGAAYVFDNDGTLVTTIVSPASGVGDQFGISVAAVDVGQVLIGSSGDNTGATNSGAAYLFATDGTLIRVLTNPTPAINDQFGNAVAVVGADHVLIGSFLDNRGTTDAGVAHLFSTNGVATRADYTNIVRVRFHELIVDGGALATQLPVNVYDFVMHSTNLTVNDTMTIVQSMKIDSQSLTVNGGMTLSGLLSGWTATNTPNLKFFTNNGSITTPGESHFGDDTTSPYSTFVNRGSITTLAGGQTINSDYLEISGTNSSGAGLIINTLSGKIENGNLNSVGDMRFFGNVIKFHHALVQTTSRLEFNVTDELFDNGGTSGNLFACRVGFSQTVRPAMGDLLGTAIQTFAPSFASVSHTWAGQDRGASKNGFLNNTALGRLILTPEGFDPEFAFQGTGPANGLYVDLLDLSALGTNYLNFLAINTNLTIYFAASSTNAPEEQLDGQLGGRLRWVKDFAGPNSSVTVLVNGTTSLQFNRALRFSKMIDSDGDGIPNFFDLTPFDSPFMASIARANVPPGSLAVSWPAAPGLIYRVEYTTNPLLTGWQLLTLVTNTSTTNRTMTVQDASSSGGQRFYRVRYTP